MPASPALEAMVGRFGNALEASSSDFRRMAISAAAAPSAEARAVMQDRLALVEGWLAPAGPAEVDRMIGSLMQVMAAPATGEDSQKIALGLYRSVLAPMPAWAVGAACRRFLDGSAGGGTFAPTPAELANEVRALIAKQVDERARLLRVLNAEVLPEPTEADRAKVAQLAADLARSMRFPRASISEQELARVTEGGMGGLKLDRRILSKAGVPNEAA
ncbi:hypothetical protein [Methylobacterium tarhaniae]|uniref:hypothetical protein n=1 Tax=Methylobacterium tarhaniae TaxID=1187852 RepID=UPI003D08D682